MDSKMVEKKLLILIFILWLQSSSDLMEGLLEILNGAENVTNIIEKLSSKISSVGDVISDVEDRSEVSEWEISIDDDFESQANVFGFISVEDENTIDESTIRQYRQELVNSFKAIDTHFTNLRVSSVESLQYTTLILESLPQEIEIIFTKQTVGQFVGTIRTYWRNIMKFMKRGTNKREYEALMITFQHYVEENMDDFRNAISPSAFTSGGYGLLTSVATEQQNNESHQFSERTSHYKVFHVFKMIIATEVLTAILQALAYEDSRDGNIAWKEASKDWQLNYKLQLNKYMDELSSALSMEGENRIKNCSNEATEPKELIDVRDFRDDVYYRVYVNTLDGSSFCYTRFTDFDCDVTIDCKEINNTVETFPNSCKIEDNLLFYEYLSFDKNTSKLHKKNTSCPPRNISPKVLCSCTCHALRKIILATMTSRIYENHVIVGLRFASIDNFIYIQIAEGKLESTGYISNFSWVPVTVKETGDNPFDTTITLFGKKILLCGQVLLPQDYVLTGVKFSLHKLYGRDGFKFGVHGVKFDYDTGLLDLKNQKFILLPDTELGGNATKEPDVIEFMYNTYVFAKAPRMMPKFNPSIVMPKILEPLCGFGIFFEKTFLSLKLFALDYSLHIDITQMKEMNITLSRPLSLN